MYDALLNFLGTLAAYVAGTAISAVVLGFMVNKFVIKKIVKNPDVQDLILLFRESKEKLAELLEVQKNGKA